MTFSQSVWFIPAVVFIAVAVTFCFYAVSSYCAKKGTP